MRKYICVFLGMIFVLGCGDSLVYSDYQPTTNSSWSKDEIVEFQFDTADTLSQHHLFITLRNDSNYPYSNLFLIASMEFPSGMIIRDTLEYQMAEPDGKWLGQGSGSLIENRLWYKENIVFPASGVYTLRVAHAMRANGSVDGIDLLPGITDVGLEIEKSE